MTVAVNLPQRTAAPRGLWRFGRPTGLALLILLLGFLTLYPMAMLVELCEAVDRRPYMRGHGERVCGLAEKITVRLGWNGERLRWLRVGARLHDLGKLAVCDDV